MRCHPVPCPNDPAATGCVPPIDDEDDADVDDSSSRSRQDTTARLSASSVLALRRVGIHKPKCLMG